MISEGKIFKQNISYSNKSARFAMKSGINKKSWFFKKKRDGLCIISMRKFIIWQIDRITTSSKCYKVYIIVERNIRPNSISKILLFHWLRLNTLCIYVTIEYREHLRNDLYHHVCAYRITYDTTPFPLLLLLVYGSITLRTYTILFLSCNSPGGVAVDITTGIYWYNNSQCSKLVSFRTENKSPLRASICSWQLLIFHKSSAMY